MIGVKISMLDISKHRNQLSYHWEWKVIIGKDVMMAPNATISTQDHKYLEDGYDKDVVGTVLIDDFIWV